MSLKSFQGQQLNGQRATLEPIRRLQPAVRPKVALFWQQITSHVFSFNSVRSLTLAKLATPLWTSVKSPPKFPN